MLWRDARFQPRSLGLFFGYFPACGYVKHGGDVAAYGFLVSNNFFLGDLHFAVDEDLVGSRISHYGAVIIQKFMQALVDDFVAVTVFEYVSVSYDGFKPKCFLKFLGVTS